MHEGPTDNPTRQDILSLLESQGGMQRTQLCQATGKGWGTIGHHLNVLERTGRVDLETHHGGLWAFRTDLSLADRDLIVVLANPERQRVLQQLSEGDRATITQLSQELESSQKVIRTHLSHLMDAGVVTRQGSRPHYYAPTHWFLDLFRR